MILKASLMLLLVLIGSTTSFSADTGLVNKDKISSVEERRILVSIEDEYDRLREREDKIDSREMELKTLEMEVDKKLAAMQQLRNELVKLLDRKDVTEEERVAELSKIYEKMNPQKAAVLIKSLDYQLAVDLLLGIKKKTAGKILDNLDPETATQLSKAFTKIPVKDKSGY